jgi:hypothetical protein
LNVESLKLLQDSFGTLFWNKVAAVWQDNALEIGPGSNVEEKIKLT